MLKKKIRGKYGNEGSRRKIKLTIREEERKRKINFFLSREVDEKRTKGVKDRRKERVGENESDLQQPWWHSWRLGGHSREGQGSSAGRQQPEGLHRRGLKIQTNQLNKKERRKQKGFKK